MIPVVRHANEDEVNDFLYRWFIGLSDDGYDLDWEVYRVTLAMPFKEQYRRFNDTISYFLDQGYTLYEFYQPFLLRVQSVSDRIDFILAYDEVHSWADVQAFTDKLARLDGNKINLRTMADKSWINEVYLGEQLFSRLSRFNQVQIHDLTNTPVYFDWLGNSTFTNNPEHRLMDFSDERYRLLGLFRLWNAMEYFFPYMDIIDYCWHELLLEFIPKMLEGTDRLSYNQTLTMLASRLRDAHIVFANRRQFLNQRFGEFVAPAILTEAEGRLVVYDIHHDIQACLSVVTLYFR